MDEEDVGEDLSRDVSSLRAVLESEDEEERRLEENTSCFGESSGTPQQDIHITALEKLRLCWQENLKLQSELHTLLCAIKKSLNTNRYNRERLEILMRQNRRYPKTSICSYLKASKPTKSRLPYFVDFKMEAAPHNNESIQLARGFSVPDFYFTSYEWVTADCAKLKAGVKQKNMELLAKPLKKQMSKPGITVIELKALENDIQELRNKDKAVLLKYSQEIDWDSLAYEQFGTEKSGIDCLLRYKNYEQPSISRSVWKREEEKRLMRLAKVKGLRHWEEIAQELKTNRSAIQCMSHYQKALNPDFLNRKWTKEEDLKMQEAMKIYGSNWGLVATYIGNRTSVQCTNRNHAMWNRHRKSGRWTDEEDKLLHEAINKYGDVGTVWTRIASYVQSRTSTQCRERWRTVVQGKNLLRPWTDVETNRTIEYGRMQLEKGEQMHWAELGRELNRRDDDCRRQWISKAPKEDLMKYRTLVVKSQSCIKSKRISIRTDDPMNEPTVQAKDLEDDMMSEKAKKELSDYQKALNRKDKHKSVPKKKSQRKGQGGSRMSDQCPVVIPLHPSLLPYFHSESFPLATSMPSTLPQIIVPPVLSSSNTTIPSAFPFQDHLAQLSPNFCTSKRAITTNTTAVTSEMSCTHMATSNSSSSMSLTLPLSTNTAPSSSSPLPVSAELFISDQGSQNSRNLTAQSKRRKVD